MEKPSLIRPRGVKEAEKMDIKTVELELTQAEREALIDILDTYMSNLRMEISHTDRQDFRDMLKSRKNVVMKVLDRLI